MPAPAPSPAAAARSESWPNRAAGHAAWLLPLLLAVLLAWHSLGERDIWLHHRAGSDLLAQHAWTRTGTYSFTEPETPWHNHEWAFQVLAAWTGPGPGVPDDAGVRGWIVLRTALAAALLLLVVLGPDRWRPVGSAPWAAPPAAGFVLPLLLGLGLLWTRLTLRPELVSYLLLAVAVRWTDQALRPDAVRAQAALPAWRATLDPRLPAGRLFLLTVLWSQFHGFAALVPAVWLLGGLTAGLRRLLRPRETETALPGGGRWLLVLAAALAGLALTPNGPAGLLYPLQALGQFSGEGVDLRRTISELVPLFETRDSLHWTRLAFLAALGWSLLWILWHGRRISWLRAALLAAAALAAWNGQRHLGLMAVAFWLLHTGTAPGPAPGWLTARLPRLPGRLPGPMAAVILLAGVALTALWSLAVVRDDFYLAEGVSRRFGAGLTPAQFPLEAAAALTPASRQRLVANVDAAGFLLDRARATIYIDGRTEVYSPALWNEYNRLKAAGPQALDILRRRRPAAVCLAVGGGAFRPLARDLLADPAWRPTVLGEGGLLFEPAGTRAAPEPREQLARLTATLERESGDGGRSTRLADRWLAAATLHGLLGEADGQAAALRRGLALRPDHPLLLHNLGNVLLAQERFDAAGELFERALAVNPALAGSALNSGVCLLRSGQTAAAERAFARAVRIDPSRFEGWVNLGTTRQRLGDREGAARALERALALRPDQPRLRALVRELRR